MTFVWTWWGVPGTLAFVVTLCCAIVALRTAPRRTLNRRLSVILVLEGLYAAGCIGLLFFFDNPTVVTVLAVCGMAAIAALPFQYLSFLAVALDTPLVVPFRAPVVTILLGLSSTAAAIFVVASPHLFISELYRPGWAPWNFLSIGLGERAIQFLGVVYLFGLIAAVSAYFCAQVGSAARSRARWFAIAFGFRDMYLGAVLLLYPALRPIPYWGDFVYNPGIAMAFFAYILLLAYAALNSQLFDINLKIKLALKHSTVGALIAGVFVVGSELLEIFIPVSGAAALVGAIAILVVLRPVQSLAQRIADRLMHNVQDTPEYLNVRKLEVYQAAVEGAGNDGVITENERSILERLRKKLELSEADANTIELAFMK